MMGARNRPVRVAESLMLLSPAAHHFVSSSFGGQEGLLRREGRANSQDQPGRCGGAGD